MRIPRKTKPSQKKHKNPIVVGKAIDTRLVVRRILSNSGEVLANGLLISNVMDISAENFAQWYYWHWNIELWFKRLKHAGHDGEAKPSLNASWLKEFLP